MTATAFVTDLDVAGPHLFLGGHSAREALLAEEPHGVVVRVGQEVLAVVRGRDGSLVGVGERGGVGVKKRPPPLENQKWNHRTKKLKKYYVTV